MAVRNLFTLVVLLGGSCLQLHAEDPPPPAQTIKRFAAAMAAFPYYQCRYVLTSGDGAVDEKTHAVKWQTKTTVVCRYAVDGEFEAFEQLGDRRPDFKKSMPVEGGMGMGVVKDEGFPALKTIRGPDGFGRWMELMNNLQITRSGRKYADGEVFTPLDFAFEHRRRSGPDMLLAQPDNYRVSGIEQRVISGHRCIGVRFEAPTVKLVESVWFDPDWGMMPVWYESAQEVNGKTHVFRDVVTAAKAVSNGRWFPERMISYSPGKLQGVRECTLKDVDADRRPTKDDLSVTLPARTGIYDSENNKGFALRQDEKLSGHDLMELFDKAAKAERGKPMDTALEHRSGRSSLWFWVCGVAGLLLASLGGFRWLRNRRSADPAPGSP
jgi:hypothetical protein